MTNTAVNLSMQTPAFSSFEYIPRRGVTGSYGNSAFIFEEHPYCFPQQLHRLHSHRRCAGIPISPHHHQRLLFSGGFGRLTLLFDLGLWRELNVNTCKGLKAWSALQSLAEQFVSSFSLWPGMPSRDPGHTRCTSLRAAH